jgi:hypothetical protein
VTARVVLLLGIALWAAACARTTAPTPSDAASPGSGRAEAGREAPALSLGLAAPDIAAGSATPDIPPGSTTAPDHSTSWILPSTQTADVGGDDDGFEAHPDRLLARDRREAKDRKSGTSVGTSCLNAGKGRHVLGGFSIELPGGALVDGIEVGLQASADDGVGRSFVCAQLSWDGGEQWTEPRRTNQLTRRPRRVVAGLPHETWGRTWVQNDLSQPNFFVRLINVSDDGRRDFFVDWVGVRVSYH